MEILIPAIIVAILLVFVVGFLVVGGRRERPSSDQLPPSGSVDVLDRPPPSDTTVTDRPTAPPIPVDVVDDTIAPPAPLSVGERFRLRLQRTRNVLGASVADLFGRGIDDAAWEGLEELLIGADVGVETSLSIVEQMRTRSKQEGVTTVDGVIGLLKQEMRAVLGDFDRSLVRSTDDEPTVWLVTGVNGTGKTTTIGKLSAREQRAGHSVVLAAADTFRAAASEQLGVWAERTGARLVAKEEGADPASVAYDGYLAGKATDADLVIIDTAGRLHNKRELMDELSKVKRVVEKQSGPIEETLLVLDATTGQNGIQQARAFMEAVAITGLVLTKLDGSSKGGIVVAVQRELGLPVKLVGLGEDIDDLADFDPDLFVEGLFSNIDA